MLRYAIPSELLTHATGTGRYVLYSAAVMALFGGGRSAIELVLDELCPPGVFWDGVGVPLFQGAPSHWHSFISSSARHRRRALAPWLARGCDIADQNMNSQ